MARQNIEHFFSVNGNCHRTAVFSAEKYAMICTMSINTNSFSSPQRLDTRIKGLTLYDKSHNSRNRRLQPCFGLVYRHTIHNIWFTISFKTK